jgi:hypothetical protein
LPKNFFVVGSETHSDQVTVQQLFGVICGEYAIGSEPDICKTCNPCHDLQKCINEGYCPGTSVDTTTIVQDSDVFNPDLQSPAVDAPTRTVPMPVFFITVVSFSIMGLLLWRRVQRQLYERPYTIERDMELSPVADADAEELGLS